jgi:dTDP-4-dehydrorhamnose reductase
MKLNKKTRIFITGCGGMLGDAVYKTLVKRTTVLATDIDLNSNFLSFADVRDYKTLRASIKKFKPNIVFHLGALTDLEYCELHPEEAWRTNALGTENVALICKELNIPMLYISSAGIFNGKKEYYMDYDKPNPINSYGASKYAGELAVKELVREYYIFRAGWMMGGGPKKDKKFVNKIMKQIKEGKKVLHVVDDKLGTPTYTFDFIKNMLLVIENDFYGVYNCICEGSCSRYDVAKEILRITKNISIKLKKVKSSYFKKEYFAKRPASEKLIPFKLKERNMYIMRDWKICLKEYLGNWENY